MSMVMKPGMEQKSFLGVNGSLIQPTIIINRPTTGQKNLIINGPQKMNRCKSNYTQGSAPQSTTSKNGGVHIPQSKAREVDDVLDQLKYAYHGAEKPQESIQKSQKKAPRDKSNGPISSKYILSDKVQYRAPNIMSLNKADQKGSIDSIGVDSFKQHL